MTPKSDPEEDMSMEEILASIRKFVTENPLENQNKPIGYKEDDQKSPLALSDETRAGEGAKSSSHGQFLNGSSLSAEDDMDILELKDPPMMQEEKEVPQKMAPLEPMTRFADLSKSAEAPHRSRTRSGLESDEGLGSFQAVTTSANSLSRLAQVSKSVSKGIPLVEQRNLTLDQLIQDMVRPMIKQWIDNHLPSLVEEMVTKEIDRITKHLK